jgi:hypothetical protein
MILGGYSPIECRARGLRFYFGYELVGGLDGFVHAFNQAVNFAFQGRKLRPQRAYGLSIEVMFEKKHIVGCNLLEGLTIPSSP